MAMAGGLKEYARTAAAKLKADREAQGLEPFPRGQDFRGVRSRYGDKYGAEIRLPSMYRRVWLGTYESKEEAACAYDAAARTVQRNPRPNLPDPGDEELRNALVNAHFAAVNFRRRKRQIDEELWMMETAATAAAAVPDAVSSVASPDAPAASDVGPQGTAIPDLNEPPASLPGEEDEEEEDTTEPIVSPVVIVKEEHSEWEPAGGVEHAAPQAVPPVLQPPAPAPAGGPSPFQSAPVPAGGPFTFQPAPAPAGGASFFQPAPIPTGGPSFFQPAPAPAGGSSMLLPPAPAPAGGSSPFQSAPAPAGGPSTFQPAPAPAGGPSFFQPAPIPAGGPSFFQPAPAPAGGASASHFPEVLAPAPLAFSFPPGVHVAPTPGAPGAITPQQAQEIYLRIAGFNTQPHFSQIQTLHYLRNLGKHSAAGQQPAPAAFTTVLQPLYQQPAPVPGAPMYNWPANGAVGGASGAGLPNPPTLHGVPGAPDEFVAAGSSTWVEATASSSASSPAVQHLGGAVRDDAGRKDEEPAMKKRRTGA